MGGAVLYNDASDPLLIENLVHDQSAAGGDVCSWPEHGGSGPVQKQQPALLVADDVLGYLTLAGHGVLHQRGHRDSAVRRGDGARRATGSDPGTDRVALPPPPVPWLRPTNSFPTPNTEYTIRS